MNSKTYYTLIVSLILASLAISVYFVPSYEQISLMLFLDKRYTESYSRYLKLYHEGIASPLSKDLNLDKTREELKEIYAKGNESQSVVMTLILLDLEFAKPNIAAELLKKFIRSHHNQFSIWEYATDFYISLMQPYNALSSLRKAFELKPSKKNLEEQYVFYFFYNDVPNQIKTLSQIVQYYNASEDQYNALAYLLASKGNEKKALDVMELMLTRNKMQNLNLYSIEFMISLMGILNKQEEAYRLAIKYLLEHNNADVAAHLAYDMLTLKMYDAGLHLLDLLVPQEREKDAPLDVRVEILVDEKKFEEAFELEKKRFLAGRASQNVIENLLNLSLESGHSDFAEKVLKEHGFSIFIPKSLAIQIIEKSIQTNNPGLAEALEQSLGTQDIKNYPFVKFILPLALGNIIDETQFSILKIKNFDNWEKSILAELFFLKGYQELAKETLLWIDSLGSLEPDRLYLTIQLFEQLKMLDQAKLLVNKERSWKKDSFILEKAWILLSAASGNIQEVLSGIEKYHFDEMDLKEFFYAASDYQQKVLALKIAQIISQRYPGLENQKYLAEAYLLNHHPLEALKIIEMLQLAHYNIFELYLSALMEASKKFPDYRAKLRDVILTHLTHDPSNKKEEREYGYVLIEYGFKDDAAIIFRDLAFNLPFKNEDVQALLNIWGEHPSKSALDWIFGRAKESHGNEKGLWLDYLVQVKQPMAVLSLVTWPELQFMKIADAYLSALIEIKDEQLVSQVIAYLLPRVNNVKRLKELGRIARDFEQNRLAERVFYKAYDIQPNDSETLKQLGLVSYILGKYKMAKRFFKNYYSFVPWGDYEVNYNYGQILNFKKKPKRAKQYFKLALCQLNMEKKQQDIYIRATRAQLLYQLHDYDRAIATYSEILAEDPGNLSLRADFGNMLLDLGHYRYAQTILYASCVPYKNNQIPSIEFKGERDLELAKARYWKEKRRFRIATYKADELINRYPESSQAFLNKASVEHDVGRWRNSIQYFEAAIDLDPENESYPRILKDIWRGHRAIQTIGSEYRVTTSLLDNSIEQIDRYGRILLSGYIYPYTQLVLKGEIDKLFVRNFVNSKGKIFNFNGLRHREEINLIHQFTNGLTLAGSGYYSNGVVGAGIQAIPVDNYGFTDFLIEYHKPSWEFAQTEIQQGSRDRLRLGRHQRIGTRVDFDAGAAIQQYNLKGIPGCVSTYAFQALLIYRLPRYYGIGAWFGEDTDISLNYSLDSEFFMKIKTSIGPDGVPFQPIPFFNRADNRFFIAFRKSFYRKLEFTGYAGYLYNPVSGGKWPGICGILLNIGSGDYYQLHLQYIHDVSISIQNSKVDSFLINLDIDY